MEHYAGIDVSLEQSSVCVVDATGKMVREAKVASEPEALVRFLRELGLEVERVGLEAGPLSQWLHAGLEAAGFDVVLLETRHVKAAFSAMTVKTDRKDARGIAQLLRMGWFRSVHRKSPDAQFTTDTPPVAADEQTKRVGINLYGHGLSLRCAAKFLETSAQSVIHWVTEYVESCCSKPVPEQCHQVSRYTSYDCTRRNEVAAGGCLCYEHGL
jgi:hypothetical protein